MLRYRENTECHEPWLTTSRNCAVGQMSPMTKQNNGYKYHRVLRDTSWGHKVLHWSLDNLNLIIWSYNFVHKHSKLQNYDLIWICLIILENSSFGRPKIIESKYKQPLISHSGSCILEAALIQHCYLCPFKSHYSTENAKKKTNTNTNKNERPALLIKYIQCCSVQLEKRGQLWTSSSSQVTRPNNGMGNLYEKNRWNQKQKTK
jgi:hypothetical protein